MTIPKNEKFHWKIFVSLTAKTVVKYTCRRPGFLQAQKKRAKAQNSSSHVLGGRMPQDFSEKERFSWFYSDFFFFNIFISFNFFNYQIIHFPKLASCKSNLPLQLCLEYSNHYFLCSRKFRNWTCQIALNGSFRIILVRFRENLKQGVP